MQPVITKSKAESILARLKTKKKGIELLNNNKITHEDIQYVLEMRFDIEKQYGRYIEAISILSRSGQDIDMMRDIVTRLANVFYTRFGLLIMACPNWNYKKVDFASEDGSERYTFLEDSDYVYHMNDVIFCFTHKHRYAKKSILSRLPDTFDKELVFDKFIASVDSWAVQQWYIDQTFDQPKQVSVSDINSIIEKLENIIDFPSDWITLTEKEIENIKQYT